MLRITSTRSADSSIRIKLEGKLLEPWVAEVRGMFDDPASTPELDLLGVTYVDAAGADALQALLRQGVRIARCSPYVAEVLGLPRRAAR